MSETNEKGERKVVDLNSPEGREFLDRIYRETIKPHFAAIERSWRDGEVAVIHADSETKVSTHSSMNRTRAERLADNLPPADPASKWLRGRRPGRIFVMFNESRPDVTGTLCLDQDSDGNLQVLEGSTDLGWMS